MKTAREVYDIYFDPALNAVKMEWSGYANSNQFREGTELMLNILVENKCSKVLADIRNMTLIGLADREWLEINFLPRATGLGFKFIALITPTSYFNKVAVEDIFYRIDKNKLTLHFFDDLKTGTEWLSKN